jgi:hypothetical protein
MAESVSALLRRSLEHLATEVPPGLRRLAVLLGPLVVEVEVDGEVFALRGGETVTVTDHLPADRDPIHGDPSRAAAVRIATSRAAIRALLDAETSLAAAVDHDLVRVRGRLDDVLRAHDALLAYIHAAVRAPSSEGLLGGLYPTAARETAPTSTPTGDPGMAP